MDTIDYERSPLADLVEGDIIKEEIPKKRLNLVEVLKIQLFDEKIQKLILAKKNYEYELKEKEEEIKNLKTKKEETDKEIEIKIKEYRNFSRELAKKFNLKSEKFKFDPVTGEILE